ncbi:MAG: RecQ family ATP-dependent DNA helicase [Deltaproteobacteria bacterium]|nr:RecQ family ATP-dependent DNA helicase [Deltaproteobacteria bacterium]
MTEKIYSADRALELLRLGSGQVHAIFRDGQEEAIQQITDGDHRLLVVQKTGWGKSFVYFISTKILREAGCGPALLVSPLLALMRNQIAAAERMGVRAATINSDNIEKWTEVEVQIKQNEIDILLISPERLANERFRAEILGGLSLHVSLVVVDEAHCISDWGHDFRPHYRLLERFIRNMPSNIKLLATTATANNRVVQDLENVLGPNLRISRGDLNRPSLTLQTIRLESKAERLAWLSHQLTALAGHGIIYTLTVRDANQVANWLNSQGFDVEAYTGESGARRPELEQALSENRIKALVATTALGMGYDKPDLSFVIHYQMPSSVVAYYQQVGRAGRALNTAYGILLSGKEEDDIANWFIKSAFPTNEEVKEVVAQLEAHPAGLSVPQLLKEVNLSQGRVEKTLSLLALESPPPITKNGRHWQKTEVSLSKDFWERAERLTTLRRREQQRMREYVHLPFGQHMSFLIRELDGDPSDVITSSLQALSEDFPKDKLREANIFLKRYHLPINPRKQWPNGGLKHSNNHGKIAKSYQANSGKVLSLLGDAGLGDVVNVGKNQQQYFSDELIDACVVMFKEWGPQPAPTWVTCVPSLRNPTLVPDFAKKLAQALNLSFRVAIEKTDSRPEQNKFNNSFQQAKNVDGSLAPLRDQILSGPVLLVDDVILSGWTLAISSWLLRKNGSGEVWPLALAQGRPNE